MTILMGIDEAGLGPILGPLAVSAAVFRVSDEDLDTSLWSLLAPQVSRKVSRKRRALAVADSKSL
jgi:ribonuclease HII